MSGPQEGNSRDHMLACWLHWHTLGFPKLLFFNTRHPEPRNACSFARGAPRLAQYKWKWGLRTCPHHARNILKLHL